MSNDLVESNYEQVVLDILARLKRLEGADITVGQLAELSSDMGVIEGGELRIHSDWADPKEPGDGFSGVRILGSFEYPVGSGKYYAVVGVNNDALTFGLSSVDGSGIFCSGNATIDQDGISGTDLLKWMIKQTATQDTYTRTGKLGMALQEGGGDTPVWELSYESDAGAELVSNGGFESDFTNWNKTTEVGGYPWAITGVGGLVYAGTKALQGILYNIGSSAYTVTLVLTSDRIVVTGDTNYSASAYLRKDINALSGTVTSSVFKMEVKWYDHASAGSLISTDIVSTESISATTAYTNKSAALKSPSSALSASIVITGEVVLPASAHVLNGSIFVDSVSFSAITINQKLQLTDDGLATTNGMFPHSASMFPEECIATAALTYALNAAQIYAHYAYIVQASANDGDEYVYTCMLDKGTYTLDYLYVKGASGGKADIYVDDVKVVSLLDHYNSSVAYNQRSTTTSISVTYSGRHEIKLKVNGKHASSADYCLTHTKITMRRTGA